MSFTIRLTETFTDASLPLMRRDALLNEGSLFLYDFGDPWCAPNTPGALSATSSLRDLIDNGAKADVSAGGFSQLAGQGGIASSGVAGSLVIGAPGASDLSATNAEFVVIFWIKTPAAGFAATPYQRLFTMGAAANGNSAQWYVDTGVDGRTYRFQYGLGAGVVNQQLAAQNTGAVRQYAMHVRPASGLLAVYVNGVIQTQTAPGPFTLQGAAALQPRFNGGWIGTVYRLYEENLTVSGHSAQEQITADFAANSGRFE